MIKESLRLIAVILLIIIIVMDDFPFYRKMKDASTQFFIAIIFVVLIYYDTTLGFIMGLVLMLIYFEIYKNVKKNKNIVDTDTFINNGTIKEGTEGKEGVSNDTLRCINDMDYISEEHLFSAQNNVFDVKNFQSEIKGVEKGFNQESVYGVQGLDIDNLNHKGFDPDEKFQSWQSE